MQETKAHKKRVEQDVRDMQQIQICTKDTWNEVKIDNQVKKVLSKNWNNFIKTQMQNHYLLEIISIMIQLTTKNAQNCSLVFQLAPS